MASSVSLGHFSHMRPSAYSMDRRTDSSLSLKESKSVFTAPTEEILLFDEPKLNIVFAWKFVVSKKRRRR